jgi:deoxyribodipyrimidine photo-lyase
MRTIAWFRRDLRVADNRMLERATRDGMACPVFVIDPQLMSRHAAADRRRAWFRANVAALDETLAAHGSGLTVLIGTPERVLPAFAAEIGAGGVVAARDHDPVAVERDRRVARAVDLDLVNDQTIVAPGRLRTADGTPYAVYTPFRQALEATVREGEDELLREASADLRRLASRPAAGSRPLDALAPAAIAGHLPPAGESAARDHLRAFAQDGLDRYAADRDRLGLDATSRLSPYLRVGAISVRAAWRAARAAPDDAWRRELGWREFFAHRHAVGARSPQRGAPTPPADDDVDVDTDLVEAWREGRTGYPLVDAGMRQLAAIGWMHNRARLVTASFLVKDIGADWRVGETAFMERLLDGDAAQNEGNWRWVAGIGAGAAPFPRIFNPTVQARRFDPDGMYVRHWVPELADEPAETIHEPWTSPAPPADYPAPILDHAEARLRALARFDEARAAARRRP